MNLLKPLNLSDYQERIETILFKGYKWNCYEVQLYYLTKGSSNQSIGCHVICFVQGSGRLDGHHYCDLHFLINVHSVKHCKAPSNIFYEEKNDYIVTKMLIIRLLCNI